MPTADAPALLDTHSFLLWASWFNYYFKFFWYFLPLALLAGAFNAVMKEYL